jgi:hypothetical protein
MTIGGCEVYSTSTGVQILLRCTHFFLFAVSQSTMAKLNDVTKFIIEITDEATWQSVLEASDDKIFGNFYYLHSIFFNFIRRQLWIATKIGVANVKL